MAAEDAAIRVQFIEDDELQIFEKPRPLRVVRQDAFVKHVGIAEHDVSARTDRRARILRRIAVVGINADRRSRRTRSFAHCIRSSS